MYEYPASPLCTTAALASISPSLLYKGVLNSEYSPGDGLRSLVLNGTSAAGGLASLRLLLLQYAQKISRPSMTIAPATIPTTMATVFRFDDL